MTDNTNTTITCYGIDLGGGNQSHDPIKMSMTEVSGADGPTLRCEQCGVRVTLDE